MNELNSLHENNIWENSSEKITSIYNAQGFIYALFII